MDHLIFGTLATLEKRVERLRSRRSGVYHGSRLQPEMPPADEEPLIIVTTHTDQSVTAVNVHIVEPQPHTVTLTATAVDFEMLEFRYGERWQGRLPAQPQNTLVRYRVSAVLHDGVELEAEQPLFAYLVGDPQAPAWTRSAIIYQIFPDRFAAPPGQTLPDYDDPNRIFGGTLSGISANLGYLDELGVNTLWLNPFFPDSTHHGYHATDYFTVNPRLGSADDLRRLVDDAHSRGMRVILDFVANHWGSGHHTFQQALQDQSHDFANWYYWQQWPDRYQMFFDVPDLPRVNTDFPAARDYLLRAAAHWTDFGFDGFRLDYAVGPSDAFWSAFRQTVRSRNPDCWIFGEVVEGPDSQLRYIGRFDGCLDFLLAFALRATFATRSMPLSHFAHLLAQHERYFPDWYSRPSFLDNHDMDRFSFLAGGDLRRLQLAALCQFTLAGPPIIYYGTEVSVPQRTLMHASASFGMAEARRPMLWGAAQDQSLQRSYKELIRLRRRHPSIVRERRQTLLVDDSRGLFAYRYSDLLVVLNRSEQPQQLQIAGQSLQLQPVSGVTIDV